MLHTGSQGRIVPPMPVPALLTWGAANFRDLPWRHPGVSEWHFLIAEVLLKREIGERAAPIWAELIRRYPTPARLARARRTSLVRILKPLGLQNQRADTLLRLAKIIKDEFEGQLPPYETLLKLPGVGPYAAGALEIFVRGGRVPLLDPNIVRIGTRFFGLKATSARERRHLAQMILDHAPHGDEASYYYALLDLGAKVCRTKPKCAECPLSSHCNYARANSRSLG